MVAAGAAAASAGFVVLRMMTTLISADSIVATAIDQRRRLRIGRERKHGNSDAAAAALLQLRFISSPTEVVFKAETLLSTNWAAGAFSVSPSLSRV